ncbi:MAG: site-specific DNA-methyltransferase [Gammaproteobacteria bacterium HGW-Gammaproteobacteria-2]|jgi:adenine-specific DNA-methyltransferase|nr:MAG: site-specific DNA-methyltransferase [Gammaproteobacteria bacterium HGW-Gammaproteobacteria-2]
MDKLKMHSPNLTQGNIARIRELFPDCVTEAKGEDGSVKLAVDFDQLRQQLSESLVEGPQERYQLNWPGKREALLTANAPIAKTLRPCREESVDFDTTQNLFIEGDNLDALKLLQETYLGKVKMIYIDPPYNTGNDFIYEDDFAEDAGEYLLRSNQIDEEGNRLIANTAANGRLHSGWISMMYSRIKLARVLLHDNGLIFLSIDDNEVANLMKVCDEIFGGDNFVGSMSWLKKRKGSFLSKKLVSVTEWLLVYGKSESVRLFGGKADESESQPLIKRTNPVGILKFPPGKVETKLPDGTYKAGNYGEGSSSVELLSTASVRHGLIADPFSLKGHFIWGQDYLDTQIKNGARLIINTKSFQVRAFKAPDSVSHKGLSTFVNGVELGATNEDGYEQLRDLLQTEGIMSYPKPVNYIKYLIGATTNWDKSAIVLDFFAGSSTTAHAVMQLNAEDDGNRRFIMVQLPEPCDEKSEAFKAGYETIAEVSKERIRRAGKKISEGIMQVDTGFRVLKIDTSNMADVYYAPDSLDKGQIELLVDNIKPDRTAEDLLFQVMLDWGVDLALPITRQTMQGKDVFFVDGDALAACFDAHGGIDEGFVKELAMHKPLRVVFRDAGFKDSAVKINVEQIFKLLSPATDVKCI